MSKKGFERIEAVCPYYCQETPGTIYCLSPVGENSHLIVTFESRDAKRRWVETYCCHEYREPRKCRIARMLDEDSE